MLHKHPIHRSFYCVIRRMETVSYWYKVKRKASPFLTAVVLLFLLKETPSVVHHAFVELGELFPPFQREGHHRIPPSFAHLLKGTHGTISWINTHVPRDRELLYLGRMRAGIRLRYYTYPRKGRWHYIYSMAEAQQAHHVLDEGAPAYVVMEDLPGFNDFPIPETWRVAGRDPAQRMIYYEVHDRADSE